MVDSAYPSPMKLPLIWYNNYDAVAQLQAVILSDMVKGATCMPIEFDQLNSYYIRVLMVNGQECYMAAIETGSELGTYEC
jgi:hypothetical protein